MDDMTTTTYNVIFHPTGDPDPAITILFEDVSADKALREIAKMAHNTDGAEIVPHLSIPAALNRFGVLQSWELRQDDQKIGMVGIAHALTVTPLPNISKVEL